MFATTIKDLLAKKLRLFTTSLAVLLGVAFMAGTLVLTDTIGKTFEDLFADVYAGTDAYVRSEASVSFDFMEQRGRVDAGVVETVASVEGVVAAEGFIQGYAQLVDKTGAAVGDPASGAPTFGGNWGAVEDLNPFDLAAGHAPETDDQVVIDRASAETTRYAIGDTATVLTKTGTHQVEVVGIATFGEADSPAGASYVLFSDEAAQSLVAEPGSYDGVAAVAADGVSQEQLAERIAQVAPEGAEVLTGAALTEENQSTIEEQLSFFNIFLLAFAVIALFVGSFIIYNTFSILVAQRTKEMALLRAVGASRRQVLGSVLAEATLVGLIASGLGLVAGIGVASGLRALLAAFGLEIPAGSVVVQPSTVVASLVAGLAVSVGSAFFPARRAAKTPPVAAMRDVAVDTSHRSRLRMVLGSVLTVLGAASLLGGLFAGGDSAPATVGFGAVVVFLGVAALGPVIARPMSRLLGAPLPALKGMTGTLAQANAMRNPKRTASTAAALMIGVALVGFITILASSTKASINDTLDQALVGDFVITSGTMGSGGFSPELTERVAELPEVGAVASMRSGPVEIDGAPGLLSALDPSTVGQIVDLGVSEGDLADLGDRQIAVLDDVATERGWELSEAVPVRFADTGVQELTVAVIYGQDQPVGNWFVGLAAWEASVVDQFDAQVFVNPAEGVSPDQARAAIEAVTADFPTAQLQDRSEFKAAQGAQVDQMLNLIYVLLALAIVIALLGIANTLALSIFERTRELGLLRAVGMTQDQLRSTVRWESVLIALLGTGMGLAIGLFFGWAIVTALGEEGINTFQVPVGQLAVVTVLAALAGVLAAVLPARRAARLDVLDAITTT